MSGQQKAVVGGHEEGVRLDIFLITAFPDLSRKKAKKLIDARLVSVDGKIERLAGRLLRAGQKVEAAKEPEESKSQAIPDLCLLYQDGALVAVDKPPGLVSGPTKDKDRPYAEKLAREKWGGRLTLLHRLDRDTSGVLLLARTEEAARTLFEAFKKREVAKTYLAVASGRTPEEFEDVCHLKEAPNSRVVVVGSGGMRAETGFRTLARAEGWSLVEAKPKTGRMHQIRIQLARLGHPIAGDAVYGGAARVEAGGKSLPVGRQLLHAWKAGFRHPSTNAWTEIESPPPEDFLAVAKLLFGPAVPGIYR